MQLRENKSDVYSGGVSSPKWACGAAGSALPWHGRGRRFDPDQVHQLLLHLNQLFKFTHMSGFGSDVLADLLARMAEEQALHDRLKSSRIDNETAGMLMAQERFGFAAGRSGAMVTVARDSAALNSEPSRIVEADPVLIRVDVYV